VRRREWHSEWQSEWQNEWQREWGSEWGDYLGQNTHVGRSPAREAASWEHTPPWRTPDAFPARVWDKQQWLEERRVNTCVWVCVGGWVRWCVRCPRQRE
jgi:hypothetical protein